jgi:hypothetical protein
MYYLAPEIFLTVSWAGKQDYLPCALFFLYNSTLSLLRNTAP